MASTHGHRYSLAQVQENPSLLQGCGCSSLAWLAHEAESFEPDGDDITMGHIHDELAQRPDAETEKRIFQEEYRRLWPEHVAYRGAIPNAPLPILTRNPV